MRNVTLHIEGMTCVNCENRIAKALRGTVGVASVDVSYRTGVAAVAFDEGVVSLRELRAVVSVLGYEVAGEGATTAAAAGLDARRIGGILIIAVAAFMLLQNFGLAQVASMFPVAEQGMGYVMLFVIGLITSVHCVAMCGGINLSQCIPQGAVVTTNPAAPTRPSAHSAATVTTTNTAATNPTTTHPSLTALRPSFLYNLGRVASYTLIGAAVGALGSVLTLSGGLKGLIQLAAGLFMVVMGLNMLGVFKGLRVLTPRLPKALAQRLDAQKSRSNSPLYIGLLNGFMPCGPLQAMQLYALSTGSPVEGALAMLVFSLGTVPLMFGFGALGSLLTKRFTRRMMTVGAALVIVLGFSMFSYGWNLSGLALPSLMQAPASASAQGDTSPVEVVGGVQVVTSTLLSGRYPAITVAAGMPVEWHIEAPEGSINGCNNRLFIPEYDVEYQFKTGENIIRFTPGAAGQYPYSCWMGMIRSSITVVAAGA
ncbi:MAG: sulfite exporter TauE/SafE family protein [Coriobacteriales bacterium]|jgi:sulfite exporter TauE/SafE/copper chaperone CopZ|nr:sulfite exporter TauE/SafE family protein [Coriobacteriales bacterium]